MLLYEVKNINTFFNINYLLKVLHPFYIFQMFSCSIWWAEVKICKK